MATAITADAATTKMAASSTKLASNFETFLTLLTTQLKNQDPLSPMDSTDFTAQLTQMTGVEQQLLTNDLLTSLVKAQSGNLNSAADYIGRDVTAAWSAATMTGGKADWSYELASDATAATLKVVNSVGVVVWQGPAPSVKQGLHAFQWNGQTTDGAPLPDGVYTLQIAAKDAKSADVASQALTQGRVKGVEMYNGEPYLAIGDTILPLSTVISLNEATTARTDATENPDVTTAKTAA